MKIYNDAAKNVDQLRGARVAVLGAARSGIAVSTLLANSGASVLLSDVKSAAQLQLPLPELQKAGVRVETGGHGAQVLDSDLICISPGLPLSIPVLEKASAKGIPITGEIEVASWFCRSPIIAVTGSNGKTTTTTLSGEILKRGIPHTIVAGNIGQPFAEYVSASTPQGVALLEISSFQLETIHGFHPAVAVIMNLTANHLDRYPDFESYAQAKLNVLKNMTSDDTIIYNKDDLYLVEHLKSCRPKKMVFSLQPHDQEGAFWENEQIGIRIGGQLERISLPEYQLRGPHNRYNMMVAALLGRLNNIQADQISEEIARFPGIEHRLEIVRELDGVTYVNDSKATTVDSLAFALQSFDEKIVLIAGGKDKGGDFSKIGNLLKEKVKMAILIGQAAKRMRKSWESAVALFEVADLAEAVSLARKQAEPGMVILLSPACSSFDMFRDYEDRGRQFKKIVEGLAS